MVLRDNTPVSERDATPEALVASARLAAHFRRLDFVRVPPSGSALCWQKAASFNTYSLENHCKRSPLPSALPFWFRSIRLEGDGIG